MKNKAFTLIEILIAVLIIGILAAIAVPQYQKAVYKSKATQLYAAANSMVKAVQEYNLATGQYPTSFDDLDITYQMPKYSSSVCASNTTTNGVVRQGDFEFVLGSSSTWNHISARFATGPYKCTGFMYFFKHNKVPINTLLCWEGFYSNYQYRGSANKDGDFCEKLMGKSLVYTTTGDSLFYK